MAIRRRVAGMVFQAQTNTSPARLLKERSYRAAREKPLSFHWF
jgi:hypothetical protein